MSPDNMPKNSMRDDEELTETPNKEYCPRSVENGGGPDSVFKPPMNGEMTWREDDGSCSYCGSVNPDVLMARLEKGDISVIPTDKSYKLYIRNEGGEEFKQSYRKCPRDSECTGPDDCTHWVTRDHPQPKFYFQHLSGEQQSRFIELLNEKKIKIGMPGYFYRLPYFCTTSTKENEDGS